MGKKPAHFSCLSWSNNQDYIHHNITVLVHADRVKFVQTDVGYSMPEEGNASYTTRCTTSKCDPI